MPTDSAQMVIALVALPFSDQPRNAENPAFGLRHGAFGRRQVWIEECGDAAAPIGVGKPSGDGIGIVLIRGAPFAGEAGTPQRRIDLGNGRPTLGNIPSVEGPKMNPVA